MSDSGVIEVRILHVCDSLNPAGLGGYESYLHYLSKEMSIRGHESIIVTQKPKRHTPTILKLDNYEIVHLGGNLLEARKWEFFRHPEDERDALAVRMFKPDDLRENVSELTQELGLLIRDKEPDVVHAHSTYVVFNRVLRDLRTNGMLVDVPCVLTVHGRPKPLILPDQTRTTDYEQLAMSCPFDHVFAVSENVAEQLNTYLPDPSVVQTVYLGIDLSVFRPTNDIEKRWDLAYMGRLERMKAVDLIPQMLRELALHLPNVRMLITGEGSLREWLIDELVRVDVHSAVQYLGVVEPERVPGLINASRVFLYPSREEPFGLSIVEAMACGIPVLTTNVFGPSEIVTHMVDGYTVDPNDPSQLAEAALHLLSDDKLRARLGKAGRNMVESRFDIEEHADNLLGLYDEMKAK